MKIIKDNYKKFPIEVTCEHCKSVIELESANDVARFCSVVEYGWHCPLCKRVNYLENFSQKK